MRQSTKEHQEKLMKEEGELVVKRTGKYVRDVPKGSWKDTEKHLPNPGCYRSKER